MTLLDTHDSLPVASDLLTQEGVDEFVLGLPDALFDSPELRRVLTENDPLSFALIYLGNHLRSEATQGRITFSDLHIALIEQARTWLLPRSFPRMYRDAYVAPRNSGKSTWLFLILPLWAAAHGHHKFIAAFADTSWQAQQHLQTFKHELETNALLREDFPELCTAAVRNRGVTYADTKMGYFAKSGFVFMARGVDSGVLGMKANENRPDLIILDDIEPEESNYSSYLMEKRLTTIQDAILPLNEFARVILSGTVTMPGSIIHQMVRSIQDTEDPPEQWIIDQKFQVHHFKPIVSLPDGSERSIWPGMWPLEYLDSIRDTRDFLKNYANDPRGYEGGIWTAPDFIYDTIDATRTLLSVDPRVKDKKTSDPTGIAIISYQPEVRLTTASGLQSTIPSRCSVDFAEEVPKTGNELRAHCLSILARNPQIKRIVIEDVQGGDLWKDIFYDMPVKVDTVGQSMSKTVRANKVHNLYERKRVVHSRKLVDLENQMIAFPHAPHDDMVDAVTTGVLYFMEPPPAPKKTAVRTGSYI